MTGNFIVFEGCDGVGKSTQSALLAERLRGHYLKRNVVLVKEPGTTALGEHLRDLLKHSDIDMTSDAEALLFNAARVQLIEEVIYPALCSGDIVIADRWTWSTQVYQGYMRGGNEEGIFHINKFATRSIEPDMIFLLDVPEGEIVRRVTEADRFTPLTDASYYGKMREGYLRLHGQTRSSVRIDGCIPIEDISNYIYRRVVGV